MKKIVCLVLVLLLISSLFGCSTTGPNGTDSSKSTEFENFEMEWTEQDEMFRSISGTTITKIGNPADLNGYELQIVQEFMDRYNVKINWIPMT